MCRLPEYPPIRAWRSNEGINASIAQHQQTVALQSAGATMSAAAAAVDQRLVPISRPIANFSLAESAKLYESPKASTHALQRHGFSTSAGVAWN
jgi:hypothetical protein